MKILYEAVPTITPQDIKQWDSANENIKSKLVNKLITAYGKPNLKNIRNAISTCFFQHGIDPKKNGFIELFDKIDFPLTKDHDEYFTKLNDLYISDNIDLSKKYLTLNSLYDRSIEEFLYTVRLFDIVNTPYKINKYFKNAAEIDEWELFLDDNKQIIKPVGNEGDGEDTLFGTVEAWSGENGENDVESNYSELEEPSLTQRELKRIKEKYTFDSPDKIPKQLYRENQVVFLKSLKPHSDIRGNVNSYISDFVIYKNGKWKRYEPHIKKNY